MNTNTRNPKSKHRKIAVASPDSLAFLFERHRYNPFVRFLRAAFFFEDVDPARLTRDRARIGRGHAHGGTLGY
jgi:hypothetical protein